MAEAGTMRVLIQQNPAFTEYIEAFNADFEAANPGVTVDMSVVAPGDMATSIQTRLSANDVDQAMKIILGSAKSMGIEVKG